MKAWTKVWAIAPDIASFVRAGIAIIMYPAWAIEEYANILPTSFWDIAAKFPNVIDAKATIPMTNSQSSETESRVKTKTLKTAMKPIALLAAASNVVTGVGAPS